LTDEGGKDAKRDKQQDELVAGTAGTNTENVEDPFR
jgi:hypothetical protein